MGIHRCLRLATLVLGLAAIFFLYGCGGAAGDKPIPLPDAGGTVNLTVTDAPSDQWQEVSVVLKAASNGSPPTTAEPNALSSVEARAGLASRVPTLPEKPL